jgi:hypothetical protein
MEDFFSVPRQHAAIRADFLTTKMTAEQRFYDGERRLFSGRSYNAGGKYKTKAKKDGSEEDKKEEEKGIIHRVGLDSTYDSTYALTLN